MEHAVRKWLPVLALAVFTFVATACDRFSPNKPSRETKTTTPPPAAPKIAGPEAFVSEKGNFTVTLPPGFPPFTVTGGDSEDQNDIALSYTSEKHGQDACLVMVNSNSIWDGMDPKTVLDAGRDGGVKSNPGNTLEREVDFKLGGYPGRRIFITQKSGLETYYMRDDIVLVKTRLYQIMYISNKKADLNTPKILAYFNSFRLTNVPAAEVVGETPQPSTKRRLEFTLPTDWINQLTEPQKDGSTTTIMDFTKGEDLRGLYILSEGVGNTKVETLIPPFMEGIKGTDDSTAFYDFEELGRTKTAWGGIRQDCRASRSDDDARVYWSNVFIVLDGNFYVVSVITLDDNTQTYQSEVNSFFDSITVR
ncbi:MAG: hypothetical protein HZA49_00480 [Planctomycetes bacterium]|nr:hypothetical protein [Planctomycetota bacterium]